MLKYSPSSTNHVSNVVSVINHSDPAAPAVFELVADNRAIVAGVSQIAVTLLRYNFLEHLLGSYLYQRKRTDNPKVIDWFKGRGSTRYTGTMFGFREGFLAPPGAPLLQTTGDLAEGFLIAPIVTSIMSRALPVATAVHYMRGSLGNDLYLYTSAAGTGPYNTITTDALASAVGGCFGVDDSIAIKHFKVKGTKQLIFDTTFLPAFGTEEDAWRAHFSETSSSSIIGVTDAGQARRLMEFCERENIPLGGILVDGDLLLYRRLITAHKGPHLPGLFLRVTNHSATSKLTKEIPGELQRVLDGVVYYPELDKNLPEINVSYNLVEVNHEPTPGFPMGKTYPVINTKTQEITTYSFKSLVEDPTPLIRAKKSPVMFPIFRSGVVQRAYDLPTRADKARTYIQNANRTERIFAELLND